MKSATILAYADEHGAVMPVLGSVAHLFPSEPDVPLDFTDTPGHHGHQVMDLPIDWSAAYEELTVNFLEALSTRMKWKGLNWKSYTDDPNVAPGDKPGHDFHGNQWTGGIPGAPKPTEAGAGGVKKKIHELLSSGHTFTLDEIHAIVGKDIPEKQIKGAIADIKNPKFVGGLGTLQILKVGNTYHVALDPTTNKPPPGVTTAQWKKVQGALPKPDAAPAVHTATAAPTGPQKFAAPSLGAGKSLSKSDADSVYNAKMSKAMSDLSASAKDPGTTWSTDAIMAFKNAKATAMAQWAADTTGKAAEIKAQAIFKSDEVLYKSLQIGTDQKLAYDEWKANTTKEKNATAAKANVPAAATPAYKPPAASTVLNPQSAPDVDTAKSKPTKLVPDGYKPVSYADFNPTSSLNKFGDPQSEFEKNITGLNKILHNEGKSAIENKKTIADTLDDKLKSSKEFQEIKNNAEHVSLGYGLSGTLIGSWASTSGDTNPLSVALQLATRDTFGMPNTDVEKKALDALNHYGEAGTIVKAAEQLGFSVVDKAGNWDAGKIKTFKTGLQDFIKAQYDNTQELLDSKGVKDVYVVRGMKSAITTKEGEVDVKLQPASSFSTSLKTASAFGSSLFFVKVPATQVLGTFCTGFGCTSESEVVVLSQPKTRAIRVKKSNLGLGSLAGVAKHVTQVVAPGKGETGD